MYKQYFIDVGEGDRAGKVAVYEQEGQAQYHDRPILMCHATGFHAHCWDEVVRQLPEHRIFLLDTRCHGQSSNLEPPFSWQEFAEDLQTVIRTLELDNITGIGHSMGGHLMVRAAATLASRFCCVLALDPVIVGKGTIRMKDLMPEGYQHPVAKRRNEWPSADAMFHSYQKKAPFSKWHSQVLHDYCNFGLVKAGDHFELACPPHLEAEIYQTVDAETVYEQIHLVRCPVHIVRARSRSKDDPLFSFEPSPTNPELHTLFNHATDTQLKENSHFFPMEIPHQVAEMIRQLI